MPTSMRHSLMGDLDGMSVSSLRELINDYPDDAIIDVRTEPFYPFGGGSSREEEYFVFMWKDDE